jgi:DNA-binding SARP family transcriptional activator
MEVLKITLLRKLCIRTQDDKTIQLKFAKNQELFCYLLFYRTRPHVREKLAGMLWANSSPTQSKQYFRQAIWQIQSDLNQNDGGEQKIFSIDTDWIQIDENFTYWLDVAQFECAYNKIRGIHGFDLCPEDVEVLKQAVELYKGDLLENWYHDWCIFERERLQNMFFEMLYKLMDYCEIQQEHEQGIVYGSIILRLDQTRERAHRYLMRFRYRSGDRTGALKQYDQCLQILKDELNVDPALKTITLYQNIQADSLGNPAAQKILQPPLKPANSLSDVLQRLFQLNQLLAASQRQVEQDIQAVQTMLKSK